MIQSIRHIEKNDDNQFGILKKKNDTINSMRLKKRRKEKKENLTNQIFEK